jgi:hypothetical protein
MARANEDHRVIGAKVGGLGSFRRNVIRTKRYEAGRLK